MRRLTCFVAVAVLASCSGSAKDSADPSAEADSPIVSNRTQTDPYFTAIIRLREPALLTQITRVNGKWVVDAGAKKRLLDEQAAFLAQLQALPGKVQVLYTYRMTFNAFAVIAPIELREQFAALGGVLDIQEDESFERPRPLGITEGEAGTPGLAEHNSASFIGGLIAKRELGLTGKGIRVGVVDTGIDYTHKMFGGAGTPDAYTANDPSTVEPSSFPTAKVVGGIDLVGTSYNSSDLSFDLRVPKPDADPLDEGGHGSHVAGTIAGLGDGVNTFDGVAPEATLYAIKIFGKEGSTGVGPILAAFEYAADPDKNLDPSDRLDVLNLSLGSGFGTRFVTYNEAVSRLAAAGTVTVCSAGNSGPIPFITGAPGSSDEALSVAASIDDSHWNWKFDAVSFTYPGTTGKLAQIFDAQYTKPSIEALGVGGKLVYLGTAAADLDDAQKAAVVGNVALIDRGAVSFFEKIKRASEAGAVGVVMANNVAGSPFTMGGGDGVTTFPIPATMIDVDLGTTFKDLIAQGKTVTVAFGANKQLEKPERIDLITSFSSRGPRSLDGLIKPEISAPGEQILSASMGTGFEGVKFNGTSMAAPHVAGAMALLKQARPNDSAAELKARLMGASTPAHDETGNAAPVARQGAGRVRIVEAVKTPLSLSPPALSLGIVPAAATSKVSRVVLIRNTGGEALTAALSWSTQPGLTITGPATVALPAGRIIPVTLQVSVNPPAGADAVTELDGIVKVDAKSAAGTAFTARLPVLVEARHGSGITVSSFSRPAEGQVSLTFANAGPQAGEVLPFNLIGTGLPPAPVTGVGPCQVTSAGYRVVDAQDGKQLLQFGIRLGQPLSTWNFCQLSVLFDTDGDGVPEQELAGAGERGLWAEGASPQDQYASFLVDAAQMRAIQVRNETSTDGGTPERDSAAVLDVQPFVRYAFSRVAVLAADVSKLQRTRNGLLRFKVGALPVFNGAVRDDFLGNGGEGIWFVVDPSKPGFKALPETLAVPNASTAQLSATGPGASLILLLPQNDPSAGTSVVIPANGGPRSTP